MCFVSITTVSESLLRISSRASRTTITTPSIPPTAVVVVTPNRPSLSFALTSTNTDAVLDFPSSSVTVRLTKYFPGVSNFMVKVSPEPSCVAPSVLGSSQMNCRLLRSVAESLELAPLNVIDSPSVILNPSAGMNMLAAGGRFTIVTSIVNESDSLSSSQTLAVTLLSPDRDQE